jgi:hypothetical protein
MRRVSCPENRLAALAVVGIALATLGAQAAEPPAPDLPKVPLLVSSRSVGLVGGSIRGDSFTASLNGFGMVAQSSPGPLPPDWRTPPVSDGSSPWVSVVTAGFGGSPGSDDQAEAYAFQFDAPGGPLKRLGHVPYRQTYDSNATSWSWIPPAQRLADAVRAAFAHSPAPDRPLLALRVEAGKVGLGALPAAGVGILPPPEDYRQTSMHAAGRPVLEVMAWAAAFEAGWAPSPTTGPADASAVLEIYFGHKACSFRLTLKTASGEKVSVKRDVPENRYHAHLRRMFQSLQPEAFFSDFLSLQELPATNLFTTRPGPVPGQDGDRNVVGAGTNQSCLVFSRDTESLIAVDAGSSRQLWQAPLGDVLVRPPVSTPAGILLATKSNRVLLLDPGTGTVRAECRLPNWIGDVLWVDGLGGNPGGVIACLTRKGGLFVLNPADLSIRAKHDLGARAGVPMLVAASFPVTWSGPQDDEDIDAQMDQDRGTRKPCLLVSDEDGFAYIVPLHKLSGQELP